MLMLDLKHIYWHAAVSLSMGEVITGLQRINTFFRWHRQRCPLYSSSPISGESVLSCITGSLPPSKKLTLR